MEDRKRTERKRGRERERERGEVAFLFQGYFIENNPMSAKVAHTFISPAPKKPLTRKKKAQLRRQVFVGASERPKEVEAEELEHAEEGERAG